MQIRNRQPVASLSFLLLALPMTAGAELADDGRFPGITLPARLASHSAPFVLAAKSDGDLPLSRDSLFGDVEPAAEPAAEPELPVSRDSLFGDDVLPKARQVDSTFDRATSSPARIHGFIQNVIAYTTPKPSHWSQFLTRADVTAQGNLGNGIKWKLGARVDFDAVYPMSDFYPESVNDNQTLNAMLRENYLDIGAGDWEFRLGRQHIIWGEMVGLLFGDVVSAKDMRHFVLPEFDILRIPQWAARAEYFKGDFHAEAIWIPVASYDNIGKPGAQFYAYTLPPPPGVNNVVFLNEKIPTQNLSNTNYGLRMSVLHDGWDVAGFAYSSMSVAPTFYRQIIPGPTTTTATYQARHERIDQYGTTVAKDLGSVVLKGEAVYTRGQKYQVTDPTDVNGVVGQDTLTWVVGLDFTQFVDTRINVQLFQNHFFDHNPYIIESANENGFSLLVSHELTDKVDVQALWMASLNRTDWMLRPRVSWNFEKNWDMAVGVDIFQGPALGFFGRYDASDRVYSEVRYSF